MVSPNWQARFERSSQSGTEGTPEQLQGRFGQKQTLGLGPVFQDNSVVEPHPQVALKSTSLRSTSLSKGHY